MSACNREYDKINPYDSAAAIRNYAYFRYLWKSGDVAKKSAKVTECILLMIFKLIWPSNRHNQN